MPSCYKVRPAVIAFLSFFLACTSGKINKSAYSGSVATNGYQADSLAAPFATPSVKNFSLVEGWKDGRMPHAPPGFAVTKFADGFDHPRWIYVADNEDVFIAESNTVLKGILKIGAKLSRKIKTEHEGTSVDRITLLKAPKRPGEPRQKHIFLQHLNQPFGMLILGDHFYVGNTDGLLEFDYHPGDTSIISPGKKILSLP